MTRTAGVYRTNDVSIRDDDASPAFDLGISSLLPGALAADIRAFLGTLTA